VLTDEFWRQALSADPGVVGRSIELSGVATTVVGVLRPGAHYAGTARADIYANYPTNSHYVSASMQDERTHRMTDVYARLRPEVTLATAREEMAGIAQRLHAEFPSAYPQARGFDVRLTPWRDVLVKDARTTLLLLMGTVGLVLIVAIANVGNLTLTCLMRRDRDLAVRAAMGASPTVLRTELLVEHGLLALAGALVGIALAWLGLQQLTDYAAQMTLRSTEVGLNWSVLGYSLGVAFVSAVLIVWLPPLPQVVGSGTRDTSSRRHRRAQKILVAGQVALSFVVLAGAGLLVRSLVNLHRVDLGLEVQHVASMKAPNYTRLPAPQQRVMFDEVMTRVRAVPAVVGVAIATTPPFDEGQVFSWRYRTDGRVSGEQGSSILFNAVSEDYFKVLDITIQTGRHFGAADVPGGEPAVVINERFAQMAFPDEEPIGRRVQWSFDGTQWGAWRTVVGVAANTRERGPQAGTIPTIYEAASQAGVGPSLLVRSAGDLGPAIVEARRVFQKLDPKRPITEVSTLTAALDERLSASRINATLFSGFGLLALGIAAVGVGGVLAFAIAHRAREFGIRAALGASRGRILRGVLSEGVGLAIVGLAIGIAGAVGLTRAMQGLLFGVEPLDALTYGVTAVVIVGVAVVASWLPARRATHVDPAVVLKAE
jgi:predicted permease